MIEIKNETLLLDDILIDEIERVAMIAVEAEGLKGGETEISLVLAGDAEVCALNKKHRKIDATTDVLSFPTYSLSPGDYGALANEPPPVYIGDIIISIEKATAQAEEYGHSLLRELTFLTVHSVLHLLGYDHTTADDERLMFEKQKRILEDAGIY